MASAKSQNVKGSKIAPKSGKAPHKKNAQQKPGRRLKSAKRPPPQQVKTKPSAFSSNKTSSKNQKTYTDEELGLPALNMVTPAGVQKPKGKKKGKIFVDDQESMMTILAMVNAEKEGQIESKVMKARQMEEIRQARQKEAEARQETRKSKLEETKKSLRCKRNEATNSQLSPQQDPPPSRIRRKATKHVAFA